MTDLRRYPRSGLLVLSLLFVSLTPRAQDKCTVVGAVVDGQNGTRLPSALLLIERGDKVITADSSGEFEFSLAPKENVQILVQCPDYHPLQLSLHVTSGERVSLPIELKPRGHELIDLSAQENKDSLSSEESAIVSSGNAVTPRGKGLLTGVVLDQASGEPLSGVSVFVRGTSMITNTDDAGRFAISMPAETLYTVALSHEGYEKDWYDDIGVGEHERLEVRLLLWQQRLSPDETTMTDDIERDDPDALYADEEQIETLAPKNFEYMLYSRFPELWWARSQSSDRNRPTFFLYVDGVRWDPKLMNWIDPYAVRMLALWTAETAPSHYNTNIALYVVALTTYH